MTDTKNTGKEALLIDLDHGDNKALSLCATIAIVLHVILFFIHFPDFSEAYQPKEKKKIYKVAQFKPLPPVKIKPKKIQEKKVAKVKVIVPDPTPEEPEPIREPEPEPEIIIPDDVEIVFGVPDGPPAATGPARAGMGGASKPVKTVHIQPEYPAIAKRAKFEGTVFLDLLVDDKGNVVEHKVIRGAPMGLTESAVEAVRQWKYSPAMMNGQPISVWLNVSVRFTLDK